MIPTDTLPPMQLYVVMAILGTFAAVVIAFLREAELNSSAIGMSNFLVAFIMAIMLIAAWGHLMYVLVLQAKDSDSGVVAHIVFHALVIGPMLPLALLLLFQTYIDGLRKRVAQNSGFQ